MFSKLRWLGLSLVVGIVVVLVIAGCATPAPEAPPAGVTTDLGGREVTVMVENAYPPFNFIDDETGEAVGWDYDAWRAICDKLNCTAVFVEAAWPPFEMMAAGELDVAADGITLLLDRSLRVDFSDPYIEYGMVAMVRADDTELTDEAALAASDALIGSQPGTTNEAAALKIVGEDRVRSYGDFTIAVEALKAGDVDAVLIDEVAAVGFHEANPGDFKNAFFVTSGEFLAFVFPPLSDLVAPVNWALQEMFADGTLDAICEEWLLRPCSPARE